MANFCDPSTWTAKARGLKIHPWLHSTFLGYKRSCLKINKHMNKSTLVGKRAPLGLGCRLEISTRVVFHSGDVWTQFELSQLGKELLVVSTKQIPSLFLNTHKTDLPPHKGMIWTQMSREVQQLLQKDGHKKVPLALR